MKTRVSIAATLTALALLGGGCMPAAKPSESSTSTTTTTPNKPATTPTPTNRWMEANGVVTSDQQPTRNVVVSSLILENSGWVVIHTDAAGMPGMVIGQVYLEAGEHSNVTIVLTEQTEAGATYHAVLHKDNGDKQFSAASDTIVQSTLGKGNVLATFKVKAVPPTK